MSLRVLALCGALACTLPSAPVFGEEATAPTPKADDLVVWQGSAKLRLSDIDARLARVPVDKRAGFMNDPERIEQMLRSLLLAQLLAAEAIADGLDKDPVVAAEIELARVELLASHRVAMHMRDVKIPDFAALAKERYISSPKLYSSAETLDVRHILVSSTKHGEDEAKKLAQEIHSEVAKKPGDFEKIAKKRSDDEGSKESGGLIEGLTQGETLADFEAAAFGLEKIGAISEPVKTKFGFHIIKLEKRVKPQRYPYETVRAQIEEELKKEFIARTQQEYLDQRRGTVLDANPELVQSLRTRYAPGGAGAIAIERTQGPAPATAAPAPGTDAPASPPEQ